MNVETGEIQELRDEEDLDLAIATGKWIELGRQPKKNCRYCHGRGHLGYNTSLHKYVPCKCVKAKGKIKSDAGSVERAKQELDRLIQEKRQEFGEICEQDMSEPTTAEINKHREIQTLIQRKRQIENHVSSV